MVRLPQPMLQLADSRVRLFLHLSADRVVVWGELGLLMAALRTGRRLASEPPRAQNLRHIRHTDAQQRRDLTDRLSVVCLGK